MSLLEPHQQILQTSGPAVGRVTGINHIVLFVRDLDEAVWFYRDLLGLRVVRTQPRFSTNALSLRGQALMSSGSMEGEVLVDYSVRQVFFALGNQELFSVYEVAGIPPDPQGSVVSFLWPPAAASAPERPSKLDHLALNVETRADLDWFEEHLRANGIDVSNVIERRGEGNEHRFLSSIYFFDPSDNPLELATFDWNNPGWQGYDFTSWFRDPKPVPSLLEDGANG